MRRTTLNLNSDLDALVELTGETTKARAVDKAIEDYVSRKAIERLLAARGMFPDMEDMTAEWEEEEMKLEEECRKERSW